MTIPTTITTPSRKPKSVLDCRHQINCDIILLDETFSMAPTPAGFKSVELYPHQQIVVQALLDLEDRRILHIKINARALYDNGVIESSAAVLSEPFGSGKTFEILALILHRPIPPAYPTHMKFSIKSPCGMEFQHEITRKFIGPDALIRPNLIIVGSSVLVQWQNVIKTFTNLKVFTIVSIHDIYKFERAYKDKYIHMYDIVLLKNGTVTGNYKLPDEPSSTKCSYRGTISTIGALTKNSCWSRVIYDDFDTISIPADSTAINALFTIYVSATNKETRLSRPFIEYENIVDAFSRRNIILGNVSHNDNPLFTAFNVRVDPEFVEMSTQVPIIEGRRYVYTNPNNNYIKILGAMNEQEVNTLVEMLNGDAIETAAHYMGITTTSVADIFCKMLDKKYTAYLNDQYILDTVVKFKSVISTLRLARDKDDRPYTATELEAMRGELVKKTVPAATYYTPQLAVLIDEVYTEYTRAKERDGAAIARMKDNLKEGICQICMLPLADFNVCIVRCCGIILCDICGFKGNRVSLSYDYKSKTQTIRGSCANCKSAIYPKTDLIFVDKDFDIEQLLKAKGDETSEPAIDAAPEPAARKPEQKIQNPKIQALIEIIRGRTPPQGKVIPIIIEHLLVGTINKPCPVDGPRKVLVFAGFNETLNMVEAALVEHDICFLRLKGTAQEKGNTISKFRVFGEVLLINSSEQCAGINIEFATDLVYFHKILDSNVEAQVAGRAQRIGRKYNLRVHYLAYDNEVAM